MKINKILICLVAMAVIFVPKAYGEEKLSYKDAVKFAVENNLQLERTDKQLSELDDKLEEGISVPYELHEIDPTSSISAGMAMLEMQSGQNVTKRSYLVQEEAIILSVKNLFYTIENLEKKAILLDEELSLKKSDMSISTIKYNLGLISKIDYENKQNELKKAINDAKENTLNLDKAYRDLSYVMGVTNDKKIEYVKSKYEPLSENPVSLEAMIGQATSMAPSIFAQNEDIRLLEEKIKFGLFDYSLTSLPVEEQKQSVSLMDVNMRISKSNLKNRVIETYHQILSMEDSIDTMNLAIENLKMQVDNTSLLVDLGQETKIQLDNLNHNLKSLTNDRDNLVSTHEILLTRYKNPYLLSL